MTNNVLESVYTDIVIDTDLYTAEEMREALENISVGAKVGVHTSMRTFFEVLDVLKTLNLKGVPITHVKTFNNWVLSGRRVKKGEKAIYKGFSYNKITNFKKDGNGNDEISDEFAGGKSYSLFHISQTEKIKTRDKK